MNRKSRSLTPRLFVISLVFCASLACFSGRVLAQKAQDKSKEEAEKTATEKAASEEAAIGKEIEETLRKAEEGYRANKECERLKAQIRATPERLRTMHSTCDVLKELLAAVNRDLPAITVTMINPNEVYHDPRGISVERQEWCLKLGTALKKHIETCERQFKELTAKYDQLLNQLADCKSKEPAKKPIDEQFDCLKSKFPELQRSLDKNDAAFDPASKRDFEWDGQAWIAKDTKESICPPGGIDPCLVGTWECTSFKEANKFITGGGTGFRVTFKSDGTETVDYSKMQPIRAGNDKMVYEGKATARISAKDGVAKIENMIDAAAKFNASFLAKRYGKEWNPKLPELGPGGLGTTKGKNNYKCTGDSLEYQSSTPRGEADCTVTLRKCTQEAQKDQDQPKLPPNEDLKKRDGKDKKPFDQAAFDKSMADVEASRKELHSVVEKQKCEGLQSEIRQLQDSLVAKGEQYTSWQHQLSQSNLRIRSIKYDIKDAEQEEDQEKRGRKLDQLNSELSERDSINAKISGLQSEREQVRKKIDDLLSKLADCKSKP
jgi:hypothetical protein